MNTLEILHGIVDRIKPVLKCQYSIDANHVTRHGDSTIVIGHIKHEIANNIAITTTKYNGFSGNINISLLDNGLINYSEILSHRHDNDSTIQMPPGIDSGWIHNTHKYEKIFQLAEPESIQQIIQLTDALITKLLSYTEEDNEYMTQHFIDQAYNLTQHTGHEKFENFVVSWQYTKNP